MTSSISTGVAMRELDDFESKDDKFVIATVKSFSAADSLKLIDSIRPIITDFVSKFNNIHATIDDETITNLHQLMRLLYLFTTSSKCRPNGFTDVMVQCSHLLGAIDADSQVLSQCKTFISQTLEHLYLAAEPKSEEYIPDILKHLILESLKVGAKDSTVKRIYNVRQGFMVIDMEHGGSDGIRNLLLRTFANPVYLKSVDGNHFLAFMLQSFSDIFMAPVATLIRNHLVSVGNFKDLAKIYGQILQKSLSTNNNNNANTAIEETIQNFLHDAVHAADPKYFTGLRTLLKSFHDVTRSVWLEEFLVRIFDPIIWRSMKCANATVRSQASQLFLDVFPLQKQSANPEECDAIIQKQFDQLAQLLKDADHRVRAIATRGICVILKEYWDALPISTIQNLLKYIFDTLAVDTASSNVRLAAISGIKDILSQPLSHFTMRNLLPLLSHSIYDKAERVRLEFIHILIEVKSLREIHYYDIVSVDTLFSRLVHERDHPEIVSSLTSLLFNSFFPPSSEGASIDKEHVKRCLHMISQNTAAAEIFYSQLSSHLPTGVIAKFVAMLSNVMISTAQSLQEANATVSNNNSNANHGKHKATKRARNGKTASTNKDEQAATAAVPTVSDIAELSDELFGLCRVLVSILHSSSSHFRSEAPSLSLLYKFITPERLCLVIDAASVGDKLDVDLIGSVLDMVAVVTKLPAVVDNHHPKNSSTAESEHLIGWQEHFNITLFEHLLMEQSQGTIMAAWIAEKAVDILVTCGQEGEMVDALVAVFSSEPSKTGAAEEEAANRLAVFSTLFQAYATLFAKNFAQFLTNDNQKQQQIAKLQKKYFAWRRKTRAAQLSNHALQFSLIQIFKSLVTIRTTEIAALCNAADADTDVSFSAIDELLDTMAQCPNSAVTGQESIVVLLSLIDLLHLVDTRWMDTIGHKILTTFQMIQNNNRSVSTVSKLPMEANALTFCVTRMNMVLSNIGETSFAKPLQTCMQSIAAFLNEESTSILTANDSHQIL